MKKSHLLLLLVFIILGVAVVLIEQPFTEPQVEKPSELGLMYPGFQKDSAVKMEFSTMGSSTTLVKDGDDWYVLDNGEKYPADPTVIADVLDTMEGLTATELISTNPQKHITFQVNSPQETKINDDGTTDAQNFTLGTLGTEVIISNSQDERLIDLFVGKNGAVDFMTTYVRKADSDSVLLVEGYLKATVGRGAPANWKDRTLLKAEKDQFARFILGDGDEQVVLEAYESAGDDGKAIRSWRMTAPKEMVIQARDSDRLLNTFSRFLAVDFAEKLDNPDDYGFKNPTGTATVELTDGSTYRFVVGAESAERESNYFIQKDGDERVYLIPEYRVNTFKLTEKDFQPEPAPSGE